ncbi:MAG: site-specific integrase [Oscillospiraceae bacterium]|nr:site-specific integrase [Oscillospiraceae bacterium]
MASVIHINVCLVDDKGRWTIKGRFCNTVTGEKWQRTKSTGLRVKDNTKRKAEAMKADIVAGWEEELAQQFRAESPLFSVYVQKFIERKRALRLRENTIKSYEDYIKVHIGPKLGNIPIQELTLRDIEGFYEEYLKTHKVKSARKVNVVVSGAFREAIRDGVIQVNLADLDHLEFPKAEKFDGGTTYTAEEVSKLLKAAEEAGEPMRAAITIGVSYGLRRSEVLGLRWCDVDLEQMTMTISNTVVQNGDLLIEAEETKTADSHRTIALMQSTVDYFKELREKQLAAGLLLDKICAWPDGKPVRGDYITRTTPKLMKQCGLRVIRFHDLRHTAASLLAPHVQPKQLQKFLGHSDISTTFDVYTHLMDEQRKATAAAMNSILTNADTCSETCSETA